MILSRRHKFIFIHIPKAAGQSVANALMPFAAGPVQRMLSPLLPYRQQLKIYTKLHERTGLRTVAQPFKDHVRIDEVVDKLGQEIFDDLFSFTFVRNPWDRLFSTYSYTLSNPRHWNHSFAKSLVDFSAFAEWHCGRGNIPFQSEFVFNRSGQKLVKYVGRFETIEDSFQEICEQVGIECQLPRFNTSRNTNSYREAFTPQTRDLVHRTYAKDIEAFGYVF
ncbi:sulfotransferase family 2 domain-containing protein [Ruegeria arenilitoris]|uniref:sulfotransferase family 2 domain-containing protein n=1 Tax=Ruegeria arenilitoris TaxID=1173585 RepID=UPI001480A553|nr:sulfotransferase family 2 domain-containing protein [Ruegeria arenilitoris]